MRLLLLVWLVCFAVTWAAMIFPTPPRWLYAPRWAQGWFVPHAEPRARCRFDCATCRAGRS